MSTSIRRVAIVLACTWLVVGFAVPASASSVDLTGDESTVDESTDEESTATGSTDDETAADSDDSADGESSDGGGGASATDRDRASDDALVVDLETAQATTDTSVDDVSLTLDANETNVSAELGVNATVDAALANASLGTNASANATATANESGLDATGEVSGTATGDVAGANASTDLGATADATVESDGTNLGASVAADVDADASPIATGNRSSASTDESGADGVQAQSDDGAANDTAADSQGDDSHGGGNGNDATDRQSDLDAGASPDDPGDDADPGSSIPAAPTAVVGVGLVGGAVAARNGLSAGGSLQAVGETAAATDPRAGARATLEWTRYRLPRILPLGYSRHDDTDPLEHETRASLYESIERAPGVHLSALAERATVSMSSVRHHLRILEAENLVETEHINGKRRYFPVGTGDRALLAALDDDATAAVLHAVAACEPASVSDLAAELDRDPSTVSHHLSALADDDLVERERDGRAVRTRLTTEVRMALDATDAGPELAAAD